MAEICLYDMELSGNCYKVRLFLSLLGLSYFKRDVDFGNAEHRSPEFIQKNPFGDLPIFTDGSVTLRDSQAILVYLARQYDDGTWFPTDAQSMADVMHWLMVAENEIARGPEAARLHDLFGLDVDKAAAHENAHRIFEILNDRLGQHGWLCLGRPTIADIACFPYVALAHDGGLDLTPYAGIRRWIDAVRGLPGFVGMPGLAAELSGGADV